MRRRMKGKAPRNLFLVRAYLRCGFLHRLFGQQAFIVARKGEGNIGVAGA